MPTLLSPCELAVAGVVLADRPSRSFVRYHVPMVFLCLLLPLVSFLLSLPLTWLLIRAGYRFGQVDKPDVAAAGGGRKWHDQPMPNTGGIAIFWAVVLPMLLGLTAVWLIAPVHWTGWFTPLTRHLPGLRAQSAPALGVLGAAAILHVLGLIDDRYRLGPYLKLVMQLAVALVLAAFFDIRIFVFLGHWYGPVGGAASVALSVLWIVAITNAMNFLDNMDGLTGGIGAIIAALYLAANILGGQWFVAALAALLLGALLGFLIFNFPPAKVFMGDGGSLVLGLLLAVISIRTTYYGTSSPDALLPPSGHWYGVLMPLIVMAVPLYDLTSVTLIRLRQGKSPFQGDRNHFSHRLVRKGLTQRAAVVVIWMCTLAVGLGGVMLRSLAAWQALLVAMQTLAMLTVLALLERTYEKRTAESKSE